MIQPENEEFFREDKYSLIKDGNNKRPLSNSINEADLEWYVNNVLYGDGDGFFELETIQEALDKYDEYVKFIIDRIEDMTKLIKNLNTDKGVLKKWAETPHTEEELAELY